MGYKSNFGLVLYWAICCSCLYDPWTPPGMTRDDMFCPESCNIEAQDEPCCHCSAIPCWIDPGISLPCSQMLGTLQLEVIDIYRNSSIMADSMDTTSTVFQLIATSAMLPNVPVNICSFNDTLMVLKLDDNSIKDITKLACLTNLDTLRLDSNRIVHINNRTFDRMKFLRILSLKNNALQQLDANTLKIAGGNVASVILANNPVESVDLTNIFRPGSICILDFENSSLATMSNILNYSVAEGAQYGPGKWNLKNTQLKSFINLTEIEIDYRDIFRYIHGTFDYNLNALTCDCNIYHLVSVNDINFYRKVFESFDTCVCNEPEHLKGLKISSLVEDKHLQRNLTCNEYKRCPYPCRCVTVPADDRIYVDCRNSSLRDLPEFMPVSSWNIHKVEILLDNNQISSLDNRDYLTRTTRLHMSGNILHSLSLDAIYHLQSVQLDIPDQLISRLPSELRLLNPSDITFGLQPVQCDCDNLWVGDWIREKGGAGRLLCSTRHGVYPAESVTDHLLGDCKEEVLDYTLAISTACPVLLFLLVSVLLTYTFRYELYVFKRHTGTKVAKQCFDIYISFVKENADIHCWLRKCILPSLVSDGYSVFSHLNCIPGMDKDELDETLELIEHCTTYVVCLCHRYLCSEDSLQEFEAIWKTFFKDKSRKLIIINLGDMDSGAISDRWIKAFRRLKLDLSYSETDKRLIDRLKKRLGPPAQIS